MPEELKDAKRAVGLKQSRKALKENAAVKAFVAHDAEDRIRLSLLELCAEAGVPADQTYSMEELGHACGIEVGAAVAVILK